MKMNINLILILLFCGITLNSINAQTPSQSKKKPISQSRSETVVGISFTNITQRSDKCVMISGYSQFNNNFFLDSCTDGWTIKETASIGYVHDLNFINDNSGWMIMGGEIIKVENNELIEQNLGKIKNSYFNKILFADSQKGWAIGWKGRIVFTENGGKSWEEQNGYTNFDLQEVVFSTSENGWIIGSNYKSGGTKLILLKTNNGGKKWTVIEQSQNKLFVKIFFLDSLNGWAITQDGAIAITKNGGNTWKRIVSKNTNFRDLIFTDKLKGWGLSDNSIFYTNDGGITWEIQSTLPNVFPYNFSKIIFVNENNGWIWSQEKVLQTDNGGRTWQDLDISQNLSKEFLK